MAAQAVAGGVHSPNELSALGVAAFKRGDYAEAEARFSAVLALDSSSAKARSNRSATLLRLGRPTEALADARCCVEQRKSWPTGYRRCANVLCSLDQRCAALEMLEAGIAACAPEDREELDSEVEKLGVCVEPSQLGLRIRTRTEAGHLVHFHVHSLSKAEARSQITLPGRGLCIMPAPGSIQLEVRQLRSALEGALRNALKLSMSDEAICTILTYYQLNLGGHSKQHLKFFKLAEVCVERIAATIDGKFSSSQRDDAATTALYVDRCLAVGPGRGSYCATMLFSCITRLAELREGEEKYIIALRFYEMLIEMSSRDESFSTPHNTASIVKNYALCLKNYGMSRCTGHIKREVFLESERNYWIALRCSFSSYVAIELQRHIVFFAPYNRRETAEKLEQLKELMAQNDFVYREIPATIAAGCAYDVLKLAQKIGYEGVENSSNIAVGQSGRSQRGVMREFLADWKSSGNNRAGVRFDMTTDGVQVSDSDGPMLLMCEACGKRSNALMRCSKCRGAYFCNKACLKAGWAEHKKACRKKAAASGARRSKKKGSRG